MKILWSWALALTLFGLGAATFYAGDRAVGGLFIIASGAVAFPLIKL